MQLPLPTATAPSAPPHAHAGGGAPPSARPRPATVFSSFSSSTSTAAEADCNVLGTVRRLEPRFRLVSVETSNLLSPRLGRAAEMNKRKLRCVLHKGFFGFRPDKCISARLPRDR